MLDPLSVDISLVVSLVVVLVAVAVSDVVVSDDVVVAGAVGGLVVVGRVTAAEPFAVAPAAEPEEVPTMPEEVPTMPEPAVAAGVPIGMSARASAAARSPASGMQSVTA